MLLRRTREKKREWTKKLKQKKAKVKAQERRQTKTTKS